MLVCISVYAFAWSYWMCAVCFTLPWSNHIMCFSWHCYQCTACMGAYFSEPCPTALIFGQCVCVCVCIIFVSSIHFIFGRCMPAGQPAKLHFCWLYASSFLWKLFGKYKIFRQKSFIYFCYRSRTLQIHGHGRHPSDFIYYWTAHPFIYRRVHLHVICPGALHEHLSGANWCTFSLTQAVIDVATYRWMSCLCVTVAFQI